MRSPNKLGAFSGQDLHRGEVREMCKENEEFKKHRGNAIVCELNQDSWFKNANGLCLTIGIVIILMVVSERSRKFEILSD